MLSIFNETYQKSSIWDLDEASNRRQIVFDFIFGIVTPILCFAFDPIIIRGWFINRRGLLPHGGSIYIFSAVAMLLLLIQLFFNNRSATLNGISAGVFFSGALLSLLVGILLLPVSLFIAFVLLAGVIESAANLSLNLKDLAFFIMLILFFTLCLTPMITAFVYWRNGAGAAHAAKENISGAYLKGLALSTVISLVSVSFFSQLKIENETKEAVAAIIQSRDGHNNAAAFTLKLISWTPNFNLADLDSLIWEIQKSDDVERQENLTKIYQETTGLSVGERANKLND